MYNAVSIDVSKGKSTVTVLQPGGTVIRKPFDVSHTSQNLNELAEYLTTLDGDTRIVMEYTGRYEPILKALSEARLFVFVVNPHLIKNFGNHSLHKVKSDPVDARKIARFTLDNWAELRQYSSMDNTRTQLKSSNSQFSFFMKQKVASKANLIALLDNTYPGVNKLFDSPACEDGSEKWVDYAYSFWHVDCVRGIGLKTFSECYQAFCKRHHYIFQPDKPKKLFHAAKDLVAVFPKEKTYKLLIQQSIQQLNLTSSHVERLRRVINVGKGSQRFSVGESGYIANLSNEFVGHRSFHRHRCPLMCCIQGVWMPVHTFVRPAQIQEQQGIQSLFCKTDHDNLAAKCPEDDPVYHFLDKKRSLGKPHYVYMTAGANKFLRIYYGKVKERLRNLEQEL